MRQPEVEVGVKRHESSGTHWVSIKHAVEAEVRLYDRLFIDEAPAIGKTSWNSKIQFS
jgi:hypothetical protein